MLAWELGWIGTVQRFVASDLAFQAFWGQNLGVMFYFVDLHLHLWCGIVIGVNKVRYERLWLCFMLRVTWEIFSFFLYCVPICICICVACFSVSRLAVRGVRGSVVTILMAAIAEQSHSVIYRPTPHVWRHISKHRWRGLYSGWSYWHFIVRGWQTVWWEGCLDFMGNVHAHYYGEYIVTYKFHNKLASYL